MKTQRLAFAAVTALGALGSTGACETYDPPPETSLFVPAAGQWFPTTPLTLRFTEPVDPSTLTVSVWPIEQVDPEGDLVPDAQPLLEGCTAGTEPCAGDVTFTVAPDGLSAELELEPFVGSWIGKPLFVEVHAGLSDASGRERKVADRFKFQVSPEPAVAEPVEVPLETGVVTMVGDLTSVMPGIYLRMFLDLGVDPDTGAMGMIGTVAKLNGDHAPNTTDPLHFDPRLDDQGWAVYFTGQVSKGAEGQFFIVTDVDDLHVKVLGLIDIQLKDLRLEGIIKPGAGPDGRDLIDGTLTSSQVLMGDPADPTDLGAAAAPWTAIGLRAAELPEGLPRLCKPDPCDVLVAGGGDCQLPDPWTQGPDCQ